MLFLLRWIPTICSLRDDSAEFQEWFIEAPLICAGCSDSGGDCRQSPVRGGGYFFIPFTFRDCLDSLKVFLFAARVSTNSKQDREKCALGDQLARNLSRCPDLQRFGGKRLTVET